MYRRCGFRHERRLRTLGVSTIAGVDEAGRGALAGPVVAAAVVLPEKFRHRSLNDSKQLFPERREEIYHELIGNGAILWAVGIVMRGASRVNDESWRSRGRRGVAAGTPERRGWRGDGSKPELFNIRTDPNESMNLAGEIGRAHV